MLKGAGRKGAALQEAWFRRKDQQRVSLNTKVLPKWYAARGNCRKPRNH